MTLMAISVAIFVLLGIEQIRQQARDSFASTVSGVDLIVGAKTGSLNLLLYSVFRECHVVTDEYQGHIALANQLHQQCEEVIPVFAVKRGCGLVRNQK